MQGTDKKIKSALLAVLNRVEKGVAPPEEVQVLLEVAKLKYSHYLYSPPVKNE